MARSRMTVGQAEAVLTEIQARLSDLRDELHSVALNCRSERIRAQANEASALLDEAEEALA